MIVFSDSSGNVIIQFGGILISDSGIISNITNPANWDSNGDYTGSVTGLIESNYYLDMRNKIKYEFLNNNLIRYSINSII